MVAALTQHLHLAPLAAINLVANLVIVTGYLLVPFTVLRYLPLSRSVQVAGSLFFTTCALSHLGMGLGFMMNGEKHLWFMVINHVVQAIAVIWFVLGFWYLLRRAHHIQKKSGRS